MRKCMPKKRPKESSRRETAASARNSPRHKLSRTPISCRPGEVLRVDCNSGGGCAAGALSMDNGGGEPGRIGGTIPASGRSLEGGISGVDGIVGYMDAGKRQKAWEREIITKRFILC